MSYLQKLTKTFFRQSAEHESDKMESHLRPQQPSEKDEKMKLKNFYFQDAWG